VTSVKQIGRYEILSEIGHGAMGVVYKAQDPLIGRLVALKTITAAVAEDPGLLERFRGEAKAAGALQHPNIVTIHEMGEADGVPFIVMEYLEGESLESLISRRAPIPLTKKLEYLVEICRALQYAHRRGVIHRDIKPANIMVTTEGAVKVVDFGIARLADTSKTQTGTLLGTLSYMSPQLLRGKRADARSDIWSTGVVFYELLTGLRPFRGENQAAIMLSILNDEPPPLRESLGDVPPQLERIVRHALAKDEATRYSSMEELLLELKSSSASLHLGTWRPALREPVHAAARESTARSGSAYARADFGRPAQAAAPTRFAPGGPQRSSGQVGSPVNGLVSGAKPAPAATNPVNTAAPDGFAAKASSMAMAAPQQRRSARRGLAVAAIGAAGIALLIGIGFAVNRARVHSASNSASNAADEAPRAADAAPADDPAVAEAQFQAAVSQFHQAVAAKDADGLRNRVWPQFQQIAQGNSKQAGEAARYAASLVPAALHSLTPTPRIGCGVDAPAAGTDVRSGAFAACGVLDPPKIQWVEFSWPEFPAQAFQAGVTSGVAMLALTVDERGAVVQALSRANPDPYGFTDAAIEKASQWRTTVPRSAGRPARTQIFVDVPF
jgi:serine/threonine protein kinase